jgi:hypothetical protein
VKLVDDAPAAPAAPPAAESNVVVLSRDQLRSRRPRDVRSRTEQLSRMPQRERVKLRLLSADDALLEKYRPTTRGECVGGIRPCPFVACKHNLWLVAELARIDSQRDALASAEAG